MKIYDPLYGRFDLPEISSELCTLPEVRRLSQIRLLNSLTPTLATLSELRRYAHTLGVLYLFSIWKRAVGQRFNTKDVDALEVAIILHDVATPPFGHLFEYVLKEQTGWDHESAAVNTLLKDYGPGSTGQQIYAGRTAKVLDNIERLGVDLSRVKSILNKSHDLAGLIFGVLDFDNIDNVWRMAWGLGCAEAVNSVGDARLLAASIDIDSNGAIRFRGEVARQLTKWAKLRRSVYEVLIFDQSTVASQAILTSVIKRGLKIGVISHEDWILNDETFLLKLSSDAELKEVIQNQYLGKLPTPVIALQVNWGDSKIFNRSREEIESCIRGGLPSEVRDKVLVYVFKEKGSFEKEIKYTSDSGGGRVFGRISRSLVVSTFSNQPISQVHIRAVGRALVAYMIGCGISPTDLNLITSGDFDADTVAGQFTF